MAKVLGLGGIFFKAEDPAAVRAWYARVLGFEVLDWGGTGRDVVLLSGADGWMFDAEDALGQVDSMSLDNQRNLKLAYARDPMFLGVAESVAAEMNAWAQTFLGRSIIDDWRRRHRTARLLRRPPVHPSSGEESLDLVQALGKLPRRQRESVVFRYLMDLSQEETANAMMMAGNVYGAWETIETASKDLPDDTKLNKLLANLSQRGADFVSALTKAREAESKKELGFSLNWYVNAQATYPASTIANDGIERISKQILNPSQGSGGASAQE